MKGGFLQKLAFVIAVPVVHIIYEGFDPAKPTLNLLVGLIELACIWLGVGIAHLISRKRLAH
jgi:hypothetical protein